MITNLNNLINQALPGSVSIVGTGVFGTFLTKELSAFCEIDPNSDIVLMAVPASAYAEVASKHAGKHLVNICSVQEDTTLACLQCSDRVTAVHPMFGPRSPLEGRTSIVTHQSLDSGGILALFSRISLLVFEANGLPIDGASHDKMMAKTHMQVVNISGLIKQIADNAADVPENCLPTSFKRLKAMADQFLDMPDGTKSSILSNKHIVSRDINS